jgi:hypothetical protein
MPSQGESIIHPELLTNVHTPQLANPEGEVRVVTHHERNEIMRIEFVNEKTSYALIFEQALYSNKRKPVRESFKTLSFALSSVRFNVFKF